VNSSPTAAPWRALSSLTSANDSASGSPSGPVRRSSAHARLQLLHVERLHQIVVGAGVQPVDPIADRIARGQHQDRHAIAQPAQPTAHLQAIDPRQTDIEHDRVRHRLHDQLDRLLAVRGALHLIPRQRQHPAQRVAQRPIVVYHENSHAPIFTHRPLRSARFLHSAYTPPRREPSRAMRR
jgi:hypothetical protein